MWLSGLIVTVLAVDGAIVTGLEGDLGGLAAGRADDVEHLARRAVSAWASPGVAGRAPATRGAVSAGAVGLACCAAVRAAPGLGIPPLLEELLLT